MMRLDLLLVLTISVTVKVKSYVVQEPTLEENQNWWKSAVFYQIYPRSFKDSNGDGIGDLQGIRSKLQHLKDAGITATWLSPIYKSPQHDLGYDISNYREIDENYGTLQDFDDLLKDAHDLGIKLIMDFVPNHSSDEHEWFKKSIDKEDKYTDYYVWKDTPPNNWISLFKKSAWTYNQKRGQYYLHQFSEHQPDLNYSNPNLVQEMKAILTFWLDKGVDGFRMDAVPYIFEDDQFRDEPVANPALSSEDYDYLSHVYTKDQPKTFDMIYEWRRHIDEYTSMNGGDARVIMTESYTDIENTMKYYGNAEQNGAHFSFNFQFITKVKKESTAEDMILAIKEWFSYMPPQYTANWVMGNHDNHRVASRFGPERVDGINMLVALLPGVMVTYNGEEIGQEDGEVTYDQCQDPTVCNTSPEQFNSIGRDFERTPFQWSNSKNGGFSDGETTWLPVSTKYRETNLEAQNVPGILSHYNIYKQLVKLRQEPEFLAGSLNLMALSNNVLAFTRSSDQISYLVLINISNKDEKLDLTMLKTLSKYVRVIVTSTNSDKNDSLLAVDQISLKPFEALVAKSIPDVSTGDMDWWKHAVFYQIYPRSFKDYDNDGIGDLKGITSKLDHFKNAGVTAAWLSPIYKSPQVDQGYDISDYMEIDESYGTMDDFTDLLKKAHDLNIKIVMDFVPNHSSNKHQWFIESEKKTPGYENFYVWRDGKNGSEATPPNNWLSIFSNSAWKYSKIRKQFYLHQFTEEQPDLNYRDPNVVRKMKQVLTFWLDKGVDGFRMDAVPYLFEDEKFLDEPLSGNSNVSADNHNYLKHIYTSDQAGTFDMIYQWRDLVDTYTKVYGGDARVIMTEAYTDIDNTMKYYGEDEREGAHFTFNFQFVSYLNKNSTAKDIVNLINEWLQKMPSKYTANWVLGNHDNVRVATKFGPKRVDGMNILTAFLPGVMVTYNGEEIGQENGEVTWEQGKDPNACNANQEDFEILSRDFERTPFQWDDTTNAGFNTGAEPWLPVSQKYKETNLKAQSVPGVKSHFHIYQEILKLRQAQAFTEGTFTVNALSDNVLAYTRVGGDEMVYIIVINIAGTWETVDVSKFPGIKTNIKVLISNIQSDKHDRVLSSKSITLSPYEAFVAKSIPDVTTGDMDWWKHAVFYQIYPRSFKDDDNNGIGDLKGIISKLEHLKDAGISATWLSPIYKSPQVDQGYDISDYLDIDPSYGTLEDFDELVRKAHSMGIKIIMDFVPNHSSNQHQWFINSENKVSGFEDFYVWKGGPSPDILPNNWISNFKYSAWKYSEKRKQFYLHQYAIEQPDLNYLNPVVVQKMKDVLKFWLDRNVDGFRMDAVPTLFEDEELRDEPPSYAPGVSPDEYAYLNHLYTLNLPKTYDMIYQWRSMIDDYVKEHGGDARVIMTEAYTDIISTMKYYGEANREGAHFSFNFHFITKINKESNASLIVSVINDWLDHMPKGKIANWVIGNHDNHRAATRFGSERVDGMNGLIALLPGVMVTYNGEEIGQENGEVTWEEGKDPGACNGKEEDFNKVSRDFERTPFQWDNTINAGFNTGKTPWLPVSSKYKGTNLKAQSNESEVSHYQIYKYLLRLRNEEIVRSGSLKINAVGNFLVLTRTHLQNVLVFIFNVGNQKETQNIHSSFNELTNYLEVLLASTHSALVKGNLLNTRQLTLEGNDCVIANITLRTPNSGSITSPKLTVFIGALLLLLILKYT